MGGKALRQTQQFLDDDEDMRDLGETDDELGMFFADDYGEEMDDGGEDGDGADDDGSDDGFDNESDTHGAMTTKGHSHGKFGKHSHNDDGDHSDAPPASDKKMSKRASAPRAGKRLTESSAPRTLAEFQSAYEQQQRQLAELRLAEYERSVAETVRGWEAGKMQFSEPVSDGKSGAFSGKRRPVRISTTKKFSQAYSTFMLNEGMRLPTQLRQRVNRLIELALTESATVRLDSLGASFDQERRKTITGGSLSGRKQLTDGMDLHEVAVDLAEKAGKSDFDALSRDEKLRFYSLAEKQLAE